MKRTTSTGKKKWLGRSLHHIEYVVEKFIFFSRWIQAPIYIGLVIALFFYTWHFIKDIINIIQRSFTESLAEMDIMLAILTMVDGVLLSNLLIIVIIGGWDTFVSRLDLEKEKDNPDWLSHVSAWVLKAKLATAIVSITAMNLLASFLKANSLDDRTLMWQVGIHIVLLVSAVVVALIARLSDHGTGSNSKYK